MFLCLCRILSITQISFGYAYENLALNKPTWQAYPYIMNKTFQSSNAVDGMKYDLRAWKGQCTISNLSKSSATWWVNLRSVFSIHHIRIYYRTDNLAWGATNELTSRFMGFYIYISNTTNKHDGHICFHDTIYNVYTIPAVINITCLIHGQYVIYYNERPQSSKYASQFSQYAFNELCEVEVFGCKAGFYTSNCSIPCPSNCRNPYCHIETGACDECNPGFQGQECDSRTNCPLGLYGRTCEMNCSANCLYAEGCNSTSGVCQEGCRAGWKGLKCDLPCEDGVYGIGCKQKCSAFCSVSGICDHENGACKEGCKSGWVGMDCLQVKENVEGKLALYIFVGAFSIAVTVIVILIIYIIRLRGRIGQFHTIDKYNTSKTLSMEAEGENYDAIITTSKNEYQELGVIGQNIPRY